MRRRAGDDAMACRLPLVRVGARRVSRPGRVIAIDVGPGHEGVVCVAAGVRPRYLSSMAQPVPNPPPGFDALSVEEKIDYIESLWEHVVDQSNVPLPEWQRELLQERLEAYRANPTAGRPWSEVRAEIERKFPTAR